MDFDRGSSGMTISLDIKLLVLIFLIKKIELFQDVGVVDKRDYSSNTQQIPEQKIYWKIFYHKFTDQVDHKFMENLTKNI